MDQNIYRKIWLHNKWKIDALHDRYYISTEAKNDILEGLKLILIEEIIDNHSYEQNLIYILDSFRKNI